MSTAVSTRLKKKEDWPVVLDFKALARKMDADDFFQFCRDNADYRIERTRKGELVVMPPTGGDTGVSNFELTGVFREWVKKDQGGKGFDSSTGFHLPDGADRSPDLAWVKLERWQSLTPEQRGKFPPLCPDFVVEIRSKSDSLRDLQDKLEEYLENGVQLGWLLDPQERKVYVYRPAQSVECLEDPATLSGEPLLKGFVLTLAEIWGE